MDLVKSMFTVSNLKLAAPTAIAMIVAASLTSGQSKFVSGGAVLLAAIVTLPLAAKL